jgi:Ca2+-dependent lipid-binding protein
MTGRRQIDSSEDSIDEYLEYQQININITDVITILLVILACFVFGKIWRGCSYLIIVIAAIFYYLAR